MRILVVGYFERGSFGDDLMLEGLRRAVDNIGGPDPIDIVAASFPNPRHASAIVELAKLVVLAARSNRVVLSGGTLLRDSRGRRDLRVLGFMALLCWLLAVASRHRLLLLGAGVGPLTTRSGRGLARLVLASCSKVVARDPASHRLCRDLATPITRVSEGADLAFLAPVEAGRPFDLKDGERRIAVSLVGESRSGVHPDPTAIAQWLLCQTRAVGGTGIDLLAFAATDVADDLALANAVAAELGVLALELDVRTHPTNEALAALRGCSLAIVARYHALVCAALVGVPVIVLPYEDKVDQLRRQFGVDDAASIDYWELAAGVSQPAVVAEAARVSADRLDALRSLAQQTETTLADSLGRPMNHEPHRLDMPQHADGGRQ